jgi:anaerobic magnesium-protoporphyrin IX monomethyl ester cyclase
MVDLILLSLPDEVDANPLMYFPLSLMYLASVTRKAGYDVQIVDCRDGVKPLPEAKFYGFSCATPQINVAKEWARQLKGQTIIGGAHASLLPNDCVKYFDYVVRGEGENVILDILKGQINHGIISAPRISNLDTIPYPAWDMVDSPFSDTLFPGERYGKGELASTLIGSRGCPFSCSFCGNIFCAPVTYRSADNIIGELKELIKLGVRHFRFEDDCFTIHPEFSYLCKELAKLDIHYKAHTRSDLMKPEVAELLKLSGCEECGLGVESADNDVLKLNNKKETSDDHKRAIKIIKNSGLRAKTYFVMGLPGETDKTLELNKQFVVDTQLDKWTISTFCPYPGCPVFKAPGKYGIEILNQNFSKWWNYSDNYNHIILGQTKEQMWERYKSFYNFMRGENWKCEKI